MGYNPVAEAKELKNIPGLSRYGSENRRARRGVVWVVTGMGEGEIVCLWRASRLLVVGILSSSVRLAMCVLDLL